MNEMAPRHRDAVVLVSGDGDGAGHAAGEDSRVVHAQLPAQLRAVGDKLAEADESKLDTARIQGALDKCKPGMAVELKPASGNNAFLPGRSRCALA